MPTYIITELVDPDMVNQAPQIRQTSLVALNKEINPTQSSPMSCITNKLSVRLSLSLER